MFHSDDVLGAVILDEYFQNNYGRELILGRVSSAEAEHLVKNDTDAIVFDVGGGRFDHHRKDSLVYREPTRPSDPSVPMSSAGLLWRFFSPYGRYSDLLISTDEADLKKLQTWEAIDRQLIAPIDAADNGIRITSNSVPLLNINSVIFSMNATWSDDAADDEFFLKAADLMKIIYTNMTRRAIADVEAAPALREVANQCDTPVLVLSRYIPWQYTIKTEYPDVKFVVYPSKRDGSYCWCAVPTDLPGEYRCNPPMKIRGVNKDILRKISGVKTAEFCNAGGFIGGCKTLDDTVEMCYCMLYNRF